MAGCRPLSEYEIYQVLSVLKNKRNKLLFILGIRTGFRISELLSLTVKDVYKDGLLTPISRNLFIPEVWVGVVGLNNGIT